MKPLLLTVWLVAGAMAVVHGKSEEELLGEADFYVRSFAESIGGDTVDYEQATPEGRKLIEFRSWLVMFNYWVCISKFGYDRNKMVEKRFGELIREIKKHGGFERTFSHPDFATGKRPFLEYKFSPQKGKTFEINDRETFEKENKAFLGFLEECAVERPWKMQGSPTEKK